MKYSFDMISHVDCIASSVLYAVHRGIIFKVGTYGIRGGGDHNDEI